MGINLMYDSGVPGVVDGADGHGAFGTNGGHQAGGRGLGPLLLSKACHED